MTGYEIIAFYSILAGYIVVDLLPDKWLKNLLLKEE